MKANEVSIVYTKMSLRELKPARRARILAGAAQAKRTGQWEDFVTVIGEELLGGLADTGVQVDNEFFARREIDEIGLAGFRR